MFEDIKLNTIGDVDLDHEGFTMVDEYKGSVSECTCSKCKEHLDYYKKLK